MRTISILLLLLISIFHFESSTAQNFYDKGPILSFYTGTDWEKTLFKLDYPDTINTNGQWFVMKEIKSSGSWGGKFEQLLTRKFGVAIDLWYVQTSASGTCFQQVANDSVINPSTGLPTITPGYQIESAIFSKKLSRLNITLRFDMHIGKGKKIDPYFHVALGTSANKQYFTTSNNLVYNENNFFLPVSFKLGSGIRFFPSKNVGLFAELSLGGPIIVIGGSIKFHKKVIEKW